MARGFGVGDPQNLDGWGYARGVWELVEFGRLGRCYTAKGLGAVVLAARVEFGW